VGADPVRVQPDHPGIPAEPRFLPPGEPLGGLDGLSQGLVLRALPGQEPEHLRVAERPAGRFPLSQAGPVQPGHLTDVASTDQHTVKPWFDGKLDYAPPVKDYADEGFPLVGGRLDVLAGRNIAAIVYARRKHVINVFVLPTKEPDTPIHPPGLRQGYQWLHWRRQGMEYCAVSDVSLSDLHELAQLIYQ